MFLRTLPVLQVQIGNIIGIPKETRTEQGFQYQLFIKYDMFSREHRETDAARLNGFPRFYCMQLFRTYPFPPQCTRRHRRAVNLRVPILDNLRDARQMIQMSVCEENCPIAGKIMHTRLILRSAQGDKRIKKNPFPAGLQSNRCSSIPYQFHSDSRLFYSSCVTYYSATESL